MIEVLGTLVRVVETNDSIAWSYSLFGHKFAKKVVGLTNDFRKKQAREHLLHLCEVTMKNTIVQNHVTQNGKQKLNDNTREEKK